MSPRILALLLPLAACRLDRDIEMTPELEEVVASNNTFTADLYGANATEDGNVFLSPFSVYSALGMTLAGADGTTADEMRDVLYVGDDEEAFHENLGALTDNLNGRFKGYQIAVANRIFGQEGLSWERDFLDVTADDYGAELEEEDFQGDPDGARKDINGWVSDQTHGMIDSLFDKGTITSSTRMVLANAIWFKGDWLEAFDTSNTKDHDFTLADGSVVSAPLMFQTIDEAYYAEFDGGKVLRLPYKREDVSFFAVLPDAADGLPALEAELSGETLTDWLDSASSGEVSVQLPRLDLEQKLEMSQLLSDLGMPTAFTDGADFGRMLQDSDLRISTVIHDAVLSLDEEGTEAAAATGIGVETTAYHPPVEFHADHPFLFGIRDELTGAILFIGRVSDPTAG